MKITMHRPIFGYDAPEGFEIRGRYDGEFAKILTKDALQFVFDLQREFRNSIKFAMECRKEAKRRYYEGALPGFDPATRYIGGGDWTCAPVPPAVADRKVEITGPVERKLIISALNSGAQVFMADFEDDGLSPSWENLLRGQVNLEDAVDGTITFDDKARNRVYMVAKIWNCVFEKAEKMAVIERGSIRATVLIETIPAVFQMNEIVYELRDHSVGLNCGRWDYIFSYAKTFQAHPDRLLLDRVHLDMP
ncbi:LOW QUALITY PROTEIN: hypothetical protein NC652_029835 [Populus alba x Populus x berolinensis]|nr:LOW QUALITY PROTEIN: hypothetical protein NC652_029835 [Populus alba x Populus x berolinensis]